MGAHQSKPDETPIQRDRPEGYPRDLAGLTFGKWTVLSRSDHLDHKGKRTRWICRCECGIVRHLTRSNLTTGRTLGCRPCAGSADRVPISIGDRTGTFRVVGGPVREGVKLLYPCQCDCGEVRRIDGTSIKMGRRRRCSRCMMTAKRGPWNVALAHIRKSAADRGLSFSLTVDDLIELLERQSYRCELTGLRINLPSTTRRRSDGTASLDRIDSSKGYELGNVRWVHKTVNVMRWAHSDAELIYWCRLILKHHEAKRRANRNRPCPGQKLLDGFDD